jgi:hypothetical protein
MNDFTALLEEKLNTEYNLSPAAVSSLVRKCIAMPTEYKEKLITWLSTGQPQDAQAKGYSALGLMDERGFNYPNALNVIWWLSRDYEAAKAALDGRVDRIIRKSRNA